MAFTYLKVIICEVSLFTSGGLGLGLKNLVLFTSLVVWMTEEASGLKESRTNNLPIFSAPLVNPLGTRPNLELSPGKYIII